MIPKARLNAAIRIIPSGSQVTIVSLIGIFAVCLFIAFYFLWHGREFLVPLFSAAFILLVIVVFWLRSHRDVDQNVSPALEISSSTGSDQTMVSIPPRLIASNRDLDRIERVIAAMKYRHPLPPADGLVGEDGSVIAHSEQEARKRTDEINEAVRATFENFFSNPDILDRNPSGTQSARRARGLPMADSARDANRGDSAS